MLNYAALTLLRWRKLAVFLTEDEIWYFHGKTVDCLLSMFSEKNICSKNTILVHILLFAISIVEYIFILIYKELKHEKFLNVSIKRASKNE